jgi:hypothetical protein
MALVERSWKGRTFMVQPLSDVKSKRELREMTNRYFPEFLQNNQILWYHVDYVGYRMRFSGELLEAMINLRLQDVAKAASQG